MENGRRPLYQQPHTKPALVGGPQQGGMFQGSQPMMWNQPKRQKPWYEQQPYGPAQFIVDSANKVAGVVSDPLFAIARGDLHRAAAGYVPGRQSDMDADLARQSLDATGAVMAGSMFAPKPSGALMAGMLPDKYFPKGVNPIHEVRDWAYVRRLARDAKAGNDINPILVDSENLLAGTHRSAANDILSRRHSSKQIRKEELEDVLAQPSEYGLSTRDAKRLRSAVEDGDFSEIDAIWDRRFDVENGPR